MKLLDAKTMRLEEEETIKKYVPSLLLMENAALEFVRSIDKRYLENKNILILCGPGNNGGDGFAIARHLKVKYLSDIKICFMGKDEKLSEDALLNKNICKELDIDFISFEELKMEREKYDLIIDALFGIGLTRGMEGSYKELIDIINKTSAYKMAVDIASGISTDTGEIFNTALKVDETITFHAAKPGHILYPGRDYTGNLKIKDIGVVKKYLLKSKYNLINHKEIVFENRKKDMHKGDAGKILFVGGSIGFSGAAYMAGSGALYSGAGLVTLAVPKSINQILEVKTSEIMTLPLEDEGKGIIREENYKEIENFIVQNKVDRIVIGPGMRRDSSTIKCIQSIIKNIDLPMVVDADALYAIKDNLEIIKDKQIVLTPHHGEFLRLIKKEKLKNKLNEAQNFAKKYNIILVLKGADTIITDGDETYINYYGNPGMAVGGMGDILAGIMSNEIQDYSIKSTVKAVFIHSYTADKLIKGKSMNSLLPCDILDNIGKVMREFEEER